MTTLSDRLTLRGKPKHIDVEIIIDYPTKPAIFDPSPFRNFPHIVSMNNARELRYRLLRLFPIAVVKTAFPSLRGTQPVILDQIASSASEAVVNGFVVANFGFVKKHISLFELPDVNIHSLDNVNDLLNGELIDKVVTQDSIRYIYLFQHIYDVPATLETDGSFHRLAVAFKQPISIEITRTRLIVSLTILERNPKNYLHGYLVYNAKRRVEDKDLVEALLVKLAETFPPASLLDINQGVKSLWENDLIDARAVKYRRDSSVATEVMDENFTYKERYPERYLEVIQAPLKKHTFRFLQNHDQYCDFESDPSAGILSFNKYPSELNQIENVVREILDQNDA